jgi:hypothetical protein
MLLHPDRLSPYRVLSADFDGTNDYMTRAALSGVSDGKLGIFSGWIRLDGGDGVSARMVYGVEGSATCTITRNLNNVFSVRVTDGAAALVYNILSVNTYLASSTWHHMLAVWDMADNAKCQLYIDDVADYNSGLTIRNNVNIDYTLSNWGIGANPLATTDKVNGALADIYFAPGQWIDASVAANRRKFITASGKPAKMGSNGSLPTGTAPAIFQSLRPGQAASTFNTNRGTGGNFTITGSLDLASTNPSD